MNDAEGGVSLLMPNVETNFLFLKSTKKTVVYDVLMIFFIAREFGMPQILQFVSSNLSGWPIQ